MDRTRSPLPVEASGTNLFARTRTALSQADQFIAQPALRRALPAIALVAVVALGLAAWLLLAPAERVALQTGLPEAEKARALEALVAGGIDAQLDPSSGALTVAATEFYRARMLLATEGLPQANVDGLSVVSDMPMGTSRQVESARLRRMQELDLARSIMELKPVRSARVHLALPERTAFVREQQPPRASVFLELAPGLSLSQAQITGIVSLVSTAVPEMPQANVSVVDQTGALLTNEEQDPIQAEADRQMQHQQRLERHFRERVLALLTPIVGAGNAAVEVTLDMDFTRSEVTNEEYLPETALRSEQSTNQQSNGRMAGGIPGAVSNTPPSEAKLAEGKQPQTEDQNTLNSSSSMTRNYEVSRRIETRQPQTAQILRVHAAVLLHQQKPELDGNGQPLETPPAPHLAEIEALAKSAIGFSMERGDVVTVTSAPFVATSPLILESAWYEASWLPDLGRILAQLAILGIIVLGVVRPLLDRLLPAPATEGASASGMVYGDAIEVSKGESLASLRQRIETAAPTAEDLNDAITYEEKIELLQQMTSAETNRIAGAFKAMLATPNEQDT